MGGWVDGRHVAHSPHGQSVTEELLVSSGHSARNIGIFSLF